MYFVACVQVRILIFLNYLDSWSKLTLSKNNYSRILYRVQCISKNEGHMQQLKMNKIRDNLFFAIDKLCLYHSSMEFFPLKEYPSPHLYRQN